MFEDYTWKQLKRALFEEHQARIKLLHKYHEQIREINRLEELLNQWKWKCTRMKKEK